MFTFNMGCALGIFRFFFFFSFFSLKALDEIYAERIGHGYHVLEDEKLYGRIKEDRIHLEVCPASSFRTKAFQGDVKNHPVKK